MQQAHTLRVTDVIRETPETISIVFDSPGRLDYRPGQYLTFSLPGAGGGRTARCYSLSSSPHVDRRPRITVKQIPGGHASKWLHDNATEGLEIVAHGPAGSFGPDGYDSDLVFLAAGSGITPIISIITSALRTGCGQVNLFYVNRAEGAVIFDAALDELCSEFPDRLRMSRWATARNGRPSPEVLGAFLNQCPPGPVYACGPEGFLQALATALAGEPVQRELHVERFAPADVGDPAASDGPVSTDLVVDMYGDTHAMPWPDGTTLLGLLKARAIDSPYACEEGGCGSCTARVTAGTVDMRTNEVLSADEVDDGFILACQAIPIGGTVHVVYE
ncbi:hypothetical protein BST36_23315 [Mycolicibacterium moriokaense]|uniref:Oxidoreductase n=1 Tax=Mycolicibacterium moriokaense TaxID=39691 RepID=A0AAD1H8K7_9MYCO|nr:iron-sulfur cluster-binding domain-containing protein [Mycolicibacterium moriokaense]MCV7039191.1 iron-sulfur cluster-binding domain-containing protein [Mycolicibacterium moriokaense]ORB18527.1 hypothetical protein BST36_23315 [Mycolicibacterium moriokaense]BBX00096.1 putative oxidoreductase [Mycolicibacterium moriokaense]